MIPRAFLLGMVTLLTLASTLFLQPSARAHCPGGGGTSYAAGARSLGSTYAKGVTGDIAWTQGSVCSSGVSHSVTVCNTGSCSGWVQVGWRYYNGYSEPKAYCETKGTGGFYNLTEYAISHSTHTYRYSISPSDPVWHCQVDGVLKRSTPTATVGFVYGNRLIAQGEAHATHVQIGRMNPARLSFTNLKYVSQSNGGLYAMGPTLNSPPAPYGVDKPSATSIRVWTYAH